MNSKVSSEDFTSAEDALGASAAEWPALKRRCDRADPSDKNQAIRCKIPT